MSLIPQQLPYRLFANCVPVKGASRSVICDLQRNRFHLIPNSLFELLEETQGKTLKEIKASLNLEHGEIVDEYFEFMDKEELVFFDEQFDLFPAMNMQWHHPSAIINAIIDLDKKSDLNFNKVLSDLDALGCKYLQVRVYDMLSMNEYQRILDAADFTTIISIEFIVPFNTIVSKKEWGDFCDKSKRVTSLVIHSSPLSGEMYSQNLVVPITFITIKIESGKCCGLFRPDYFTSHIETYTESLAHNTCLNRKISIDADGNIKNCPSMKESFGNIKDTTLEEAINKPGFKKYWNITKDQIGKCKDCEFRHVCTDCRAYLENPEDIYSAPLKCGYDPYTCEWEEWSTNPLKEKAIAYYGMQELVK